MYICMYFICLLLYMYFGVQTSHFRRKRKNLYICLSGRLLNLNISFPFFLYNAIICIICDYVTH
ncbi:hypothetical protein C1646_715326, partial [Rhizophagus diaphanus]